MIQFLNFGNCDPIKNSWILFSEIQPAAPKKFEVSKFLDLSKKKIGSEIFLVGLSPGHYCLNVNVADSSKLTISFLQVK